MSNEYFPTQPPLVPGSTAKSSDVNDRVDAVEAAFDKLPNPASGKRGFGEPVPVGEPTEDDHAATKRYVETAAESNAQIAITKAGEASSSAAAAAQSEQQAETFKNAAAQSNTEADQHKTDAGDSATAAATSATTATQKASDATNSESVATQKASEASSSESVATQKATDATDQAAIATAKASDASVSENNASNSETAAAQSASDAAGHAASVNPDNILHKSDNLASVADKQAARKNLGVTGDDHKIPADLLNAARKLIIQKADNSLVEVVDVNGNINWDKMIGVPQSITGSVNTVAIGNCGASGNFLQVSRTGNDVTVTLGTTNCNCNCNCNCDCRDSCFVAGALIAMADGSHKRIEEVIEGEILIGMGGHETAVVALHETTLGCRQMMRFPDGPTFSADHPLWIRQGNYEGWGAYQLGDPSIYDLDLVVKITDSAEFPTPDGWKRKSADPVESDPDTPLFHLITETGDYCVDGFVVSGGGQ